jgi:hypothetical protein
MKLHLHLPISFTAYTGTSTYTQYVRLPSRLVPLRMRSYHCCNCRALHNGYAILVIDSHINRTDGNRTTFLIHKNKQDSSLPAANVRGRGVATALAIVWVPVVLRMSRVYISSRPLIHSLRSLSCDRPIASYKASSPQGAI